MPCCDERNCTCDGLIQVTNGPDLNLTAASVAMACDQERCIHLLHGVVQQAPIPAKIQAAPGGSLQATLSNVRSH